MAPSYKIYILKKAWGRVNVMRKLNFKLDRKSLETICTVFILPLLEYGHVICMASFFTIYCINQISDLIYQMSYIIYKISDM